MNFKPLKDRLLVKYSEEAEKSAGGLYIPDSAKEKPQEGEVMAVADKNISSNGTELPIELKVGDKVLYGRYSGEDVKVDGMEYKIVEMTSVRAIVS